MVRYCAELHTLADGYDWTGKTVALFATSGGSGMGKFAEKILPFLPGARIGKHAVVGACSVVTKDVPDFAVVVGSPAKVVNNLQNNA